MIHSQWQVGVEAFADGLAVVPGFGHREHFEVFFDAVSDLIQNHCAFSGASLAPGWCGGVGCIERKFNIFGGGTGHLAEGLSGDRGDVFKVHPLDRGDPLSTDVVFVARFKVDQCAVGVGVCVNAHGYTTPSSVTAAGNSAARPLECDSNHSNVAGRLQRDATGCIQLGFELLNLRDDQGTGRGTGRKFAQCRTQQTGIGQLATEIE